MTETRTIVACADCGTFWPRGIPDPPCADGGHRHQAFEVHRHLDGVALADGTELTVVSFDAVDPYTREHAPDFGLYLDEQWRPPWPHQHLAWPDFGVPDDASALVGALRSLLDRARRGERVELGCYGGHGRTGTALAALAVLTGVPPTDAVAWVRARYCDQAVETPEQEAFVRSLAT